MSERANSHGFFMQERFDFPDRVRTRKFYLIATTPRCGSTMLSRALWETGELGAPAEYFNLDTEFPVMLKRLDTSRMADYVMELMARRTSPNGVFGLKAHFNQFQCMRLSGLEHWIMQGKFIRLWRKDRVAQAISFVRAAQTEIWTSIDKKQKEAEYDFDGISRAYQGLGRENECWEQFFERNEIAPLVLVHEEVRADPAGAAAKVADFLGVALTNRARVSLPPIDKLADQTSHEWEERFRLDAREKGFQLEPA